MGKMIRVDEVEGCVFGDVAGWLADELNKALAEYEVVLVHWAGRDYLEFRGLPVEDKTVASLTDAERRRFGDALGV